MERFYILKLIFHIVFIYSVLYMFGINGVSVTFKLLRALWYFTLNIVLWVAQCNTTGTTNYLYPLAKLKHVSGLSQAFHKLLCIHQSNGDDVGGVEWMCRRWALTVRPSENLTDKCK